MLRLIYHIPAVESADQNVELDAGDLDEASFHHAIKRFWQLPIYNYLVVFDPHDLEADDEPGMGMLSDDLSDIYRDLAIGLADFKKGYVSDACFDWAFSYRGHWARHAVNALGAIEIYRIDNYLKVNRP